MIGLATNPDFPGSSRSPLITRIVVAVAFTLLVALGVSAALHESAAASAAAPVSAAGPVPAGSDASAVTSVGAGLAGDTADDTGAGATTSPSATAALIPDATTTAITSGVPAPADATLGCCLLGAACCLLLLVVLVRAVRRPTLAPLSLAPPLRPAPLVHARRTTPALTLLQLSVLRT